MGCYNSISINAPVEKVWDAVKNFHNLDFAPNVIQSVEKVGDATGNQIGAKRILNGAFHETLIAIDDRAQNFRYTIDDGPDAVSNDNVTEYVGEVQLFSNTSDNSTFILWRSSWGDSNGGVKALCDPIYQALLGDMKQSLEG